MVYYPSAANREGKSVTHHKDTAAEQIDALAGAIRRRGLAVPATLLLEMARPLSVVGSQLLLLVEPLMRPLVGLDGQRYATLLEDRHNLERLLDALEGTEDSFPAGGRR
jgi:hypothetical protein